MVRSQELQAKASGWWNSDETSMTGRDRAAQREALPITTTLYDLEGKLRAKQEERDLLRFLWDAP